MQLFEIEIIKILSIALTMYFFGYITGRLHTGEK